MIPSDKDLRLFKEKLEIYSSRLKNIIKEANELVSNGYELGERTNVRHLQNIFYPEFESRPRLNNFGFVCEGTSNKDWENRKFFKILGVGFCRNGIFNKHFCIDENLNLEVNLQIFNQWDFYDFRKFEKLFEDFEKRFYEFKDKKC